MSDKPEEQASTGRLPTWLLPATVGGLRGGRHGDRAGKGAVARGEPSADHPDPEEVSTSGVGGGGSRSEPPEGWGQEDVFDEQEDAFDDADLDLLDPGWTPPRRVSRVTMVLAGGLVAALGFTVGVLIQKSHDTGMSGSGVGAPNAARGFTRNGGTGTFGGGADAGGTGRSASATGGGAGQSGPAAASGGAGGASAGTAAGTPVVVGKVVSVAGGTLVVQNFAGAKVTVHVAATTPVTTPGLTGLRPGASVAVAGSKAADGSVTATSVVSHGTAG